MCQLHRLNSTVPCSLCTQPQHLSCLRNPFCLFQIWHFEIIACFCERSWQGVWFARHIFHTSCWNRTVKKKKIRKRIKKKEKTLFMVEFDRATRKSPFKVIGCCFCSLVAICRLRVEEGHGQEAEEETGANQ